MGCGGSKHDVASGNTISNRRLLRKKSSSKPANACAKAHPAASTHAAVVADVKDITVNVDRGAAEGEGEGKLLAHSPDRYFSSRKDDESVEAEAGGEYFSPRYVPHGDEALAKALEGLALQVAGGAPGPSDGQKGCTFAEGGNEMTSRKSSVDLKEPILVEEVNIIKKKQLGIGEDDS